MTSSRTYGTGLDRLADLEEERRFLLQSLRDLDREYEAGDVDEVDYLTLKDGYTARAADVLRRIDADRSELPDRRPTNWRRVLVVSLCVVLGAAGIGFALAAAWGERGAGQEITGFTPGDDARTILASARSALNTGQFDVANSLFGRVVEMERERGVDNVEAVTYFGWTLALLSRGEVDEARATELLDAAALSLGQATALDPDYADPHCFLAIIEFQFRGDPAVALPHIEACEAANPPQDVAEIVGPFAEEIRAAL